MTLHTLYKVNAYRFLVSNESEVILAIKDSYSSVLFVVRDDSK